MLKVLKFGGTSVGTLDRIANVAQIIKKIRDEGHDVIAIVSAMSGETNKLIEYAEYYTKTPDLKEMDMLLSSGERVTSALLSIALNSIGYKAISMTGREAGIMTTDTHTKAKIEKIDTQKMKNALSEGNIIIVAGFQGVTLDGSRVTTLGRGGSDLSAVAIAGAIKADVCEIYTDVDGVYSADPRIAKGARRMKEITYYEMLEMARLGAGVMQPRSVETGRLYNIPIHVRSTFTNKPGTIIREEYTMEEKEFIIRGVAHDTNVAKFAVLGIPNTPGIAHAIFSKLAENNVDVDMIVQSIRNMEKNVTDMVFTVTADDLGQAKQIVDKVADELNAVAVLIEQDVAKVSIVGAGMLGNPGIAARMFKALSDANINIDVISTSEISISCLIKADKIKEAVNAIHDEFFKD